MAMTARLRERVRERVRDRGARNHRAGLRAEALAVLLLRLKGYGILARRYRTPAGEIDIVARRLGRLAFVEVKTRGEAAAALESVTLRARGRIRRSAEHFLAAHPGLDGLRMGFDVVIVVPPGLPRHLRDAWRDGG